MKEIKDQRDYYSLYCELYGLIDRAYRSAYLLKEYDHYNELVIKSNKIQLPECCVDVLGHICEVLKCDMGLTLWKLFDSDKTSNTLETLKCFLRDEYGKDPKPQISKQTAHFKSELGNIRNEFLAHTGKNKSFTQIQISTLRTILDDARDYLNALCFPDIDSRVAKFLDSRSYVIGYDMQLGLALLMQGSNEASDNSEDGELHARPT